MADFNNENPSLNIVLGLVAVITGTQSWFGHITVEDLDLADKALSVLLKGVSIISFFLIIVLNVNKVFKIVKEFFKSK